MDLKLRYFLLSALFVFPVANVSFAGGDLDDGISKYSDDSISSNDKIGDPDRNVKFIIMKAKSQAAVGAKKANGDTNINSVVLGAGSKVKNITNIVIQKK